MTTRIGINGFGRIGRLVYRTIKQRQADKIEVVAISICGIDGRQFAHRSRLGTGQA